MKEISWKAVIALLVIAAGFDIQTLLEAVDGLLAALAHHQATLQTITHFTLALACWRHGWPMK